MDFFKRLIAHDSDPSSASSSRIDFLDQLPVEVSQIILSELDAKSLHDASTVSIKWLSICKSTSKFRYRIRRQMIKEMFRRTRHNTLSTVLLFMIVNIAVLCISSCCWQYFAYCICQAVYWIYLCWKFLREFRCQCTTLLEANFIYIRTWISFDGDALNLNYTSLNTMH